MAQSDSACIGPSIAAIADIHADTAGMDFGTFSQQPAIVRSVLYSIAVIGEAAKNISPATRDLYPEIPWRAVAGIRDRIVHEYFRTNVRRAWDVITDDLDTLETALRRD